MLNFISYNVIKNDRWHKKLNISSNKRNEKTKIMKYTPSQSS